MCTGMEILAIGASAASGLGGFINQRQEQANARARADARNRVLERTMARNTALAKDSRAQFDERLKQSQPPQMDASAQAATDKRQQAIEDAVTPIGENVTPEAASISGSAPTVVKSELARRITDALAAGKDQAKALGTLGGYGDNWLNQGFANAETGRNLGVNANLANGNTALLPLAQDFAEYKAYQPASALGGILQGVGSLVGSYAGGKTGAVPKKSYTNFLTTAGPW